MSLWTDLGFAPLNEKKPLNLGQIAGPVGNNLDNDDDDVRTVRNLADDIMARRPEERETDHTGRTLGIYTQKLDNDIWKIQKDNDLKADGVLHPGGKTITTMMQLVADKKTPDLKQPGAQSTPAFALSADQKPDWTVPAPPAYKKEWFTGERKQEWEGLSKKLEDRDDLAKEEKNIIRDIYAAEGGMSVNKKSGAFAGILPSTLENHAKQGNVPNVTKKHKGTLKNIDLDMDDVIDLYKSHLNSTMSSAIKGYNSRNPNENADATKLLGRLGDKLGGAVADTMFVNGNEGAMMVQNALNKYLSLEKQIEVTPAIGSASYQALIDISKDEKQTNSFLDTLGLIRKTQEEAPDMGRIYYYRLK